MAQTVHDKVAHNRVVTVHNITTSTEIIIMCIRCQHIINIVVNSLETEARSHLVSLRRMVKYHVKNNPNSVLLQFADQMFQLIALMVMLLTKSITGIR